MQVKIFEMSLHLGSYCIDGKLFLAPMAGITDAPFRQLCHEFGADYAVGEMVASAQQLRSSPKTLGRVKFFEGECPRVVQLLGAERSALVEAFYWAIEAGAQVIDFNMGCPAKKVCNVACGSALMRDTDAAKELLMALGDASRQAQVPVTLKCRTGWDEEHKNVRQIAAIAQDCGFAMVTVHGRTRAGAFESEVEYESIARVVQDLSIPVVANGDISDANRVRAVLQYTGAAAVMIGRAALGRPWLFKEIKTELETGQAEKLTRPEKVAAILRHRELHFASYEELTAVRTFRKHLLWYLTDWPGFDEVRPKLLQATDADSQSRILTEYFCRQGWI